MPENGGLPLRGAEKKAPKANVGKLQFRFEKGAVVSAPNAPYLQDRGIELTVPFSYVGSDGVLVSQGGASNGFSLWIKDGIPQWTVQRNDVASHVAAKGKLSAGKATIVVRQTKSGDVTINLNGREVASGNVGGPFTAHPLDSLCVGKDEGSHVGPYHSNMIFSGDIGATDIRLIK